ncbi:MAG: hypothetical protein Q9P01_08875 [Anaerolineae bacterium]|nr:hypothetical protein [Anaerolineae bacterium]
MDTDINGCTTAAMFFHQETGANRDCNSTEQPTTGMVDIPSVPASISDFMALALPEKRKCWAVISNLADLSLASIMS